METRARASAPAKVILYTRGEKIKPLDIEADLPLIMGDTQKERLTGKMVAYVNDLRARYLFIVDSIIRAGGEAFVSMKTTDGFRIEE